MIGLYIAMFICMFVSLFEIIKDIYKIYFCNFSKTIGHIVANDRKFYEGSKYIAIIEIEVEGKKYYLKREIPTWLQKRGKKQKVFYNPNNPNDYIIKSDFYFFIIIFVLCTYVLFYWWVIVPGNKI